MYIIIFHSSVLYNYCNTIHILNSIQLKLRDLFSYVLDVKEIQRTSLTLFHDKGHTSLGSDFILNQIKNTVLK